MLVLPLLNRVHVVHEPACQRPPRLAHDAGNALAAAEHHLEFLERAAHGLRIEEEDNRHDDGGDDEEDKVVLPANGLDSDGRRHVDDEVPQPVVGGRDTGHRDTEAGGRDFGAVEEVCAQEADGDEEVEEEDEQCGDDLCGLVGLGHRGGDGECEHARGHAGAREHEQLAAAEAVDGEEGDEAGQELPGQCAAGQDARGFGVEAETLLEDDGGVG